MDIQAEKIELVRLLLDTNNEQLLKKIKAMLTHENSDETEYLLSSDANKEHLEEGVKQAKRGQHSAVDLNNLWS